jgi:hypothetical protein
MTNTCENTEFVKGKSIFQVFFHQRFFSSLCKTTQKMKIALEKNFFCKNFLLLCWVGVHGNELLKNKTEALFFLAEHD